MTEQYWLMKSEPGVFSIDQLQKQKTTNWNDVRNYQARNYLKKCKKGDLVLIYHSGDDKAVVGIAQITKEAYPDMDKPGHDEGWVQVDLKFKSKLKSPVTLKTIKSEAKLKEIPLIKQSRLSVMPVTSKHFETVLELGQ